MVSIVDTASLEGLANHDEHKPAPGELLLVQAFANTLDLDLDEDLLADPQVARPWLVQAGLIGRSAELSAHDLELARDVRRDLRAMLAGNADAPPPSPTDLDALRDLARSRRPQLEISDSGRLEVGTGGGADLADGLLRLLLIVRDAQLDGSWSRLRLCANDECGWAFYDRSRNGRGTWCRMEVCGNRLKNRRLRARRADG